MKQMVPKQEIGHSSPAQAYRVGEEMVADLSGIPAGVLTEASTIENILVDSLRMAGFHIVRVVTHKFEECGAGITCVVILSESHAVAHTYPEFEYIAIDIFSCSAQAFPSAALDNLVATLQPHSVNVKSLLRGPTSSSVT